MPHPTSSSLPTTASEAKRRSRSLSRSRLSWSTRHSSLNPPPPSSSAPFLIPETVHSNLQDAYSKSGLDSTAEHDRKPRLMSTRAVAPSTVGEKESCNLPESSPSRKARNLKNLSLRLPQPGSCRQPPLSTAPITESSARNLSAPPSPMHHHTTTTNASKRKPPNLTIQTPGFNRCSFGSNAVPPTPTLKPLLRHAESSPSLNSILSPTFPESSTSTSTSSRPPMSSQQRTTNPGKRPLSGSRDESNSQSTHQQHLFTQHELLERLNEEDDNPISRESRKGSERGYPHGPVLIYDSGLYLYLEPSHEEASRFDVVFNVAKEVRNPFKVAARERQDTVMSVWKANVGRHNSEPSTATSDATFMSAFEYPPSASAEESETESPSTPKAEDTPCQRPEYIHVPWDHNSEILDDLYTLCEMIDERLTQGKSVLIHCQLGVSRSASLVIAYGLYKNRHLDFNSVYGMVKARSRWVGPNMSLIYQLTDFRSKLQDKSNTSKQPAPEWLDSPAVQEKAPQLPLPSSSPASKKPSLESQSSSNTGFSFFSHNPFSLSRLSSNSKSSNSSNSNSNSNGSSSKRCSVLPRPLPLREKYQTFHSYRRSNSTSHPETLFPNRSFFQPPNKSHGDTDVHMADCPAPTATLPDESTIFSPKTTDQFVIASPFSPGIFSPGAPAQPPVGSGLGLAGVDSVRKSLEINQPTSPINRPTVMYDPRSPQQSAEPIIMRNIDEFL
ncbi:protein-tyrosine phosphatase [Trichophyton equinum CBS 127.97]|uniref:protein-tyrosine-phosphatase n=2 Tax=Trichophyton TaxID=5550 RepID=F2PKQ0_TRIEC|nr:protein-tyrosine phosphatase [Trichophyton equinum CBS 127.97]